jgi:hypothetical protein
MKGLTSIERIVLESIDHESLPIQEVIHRSGLQENVCFNILQALIIKGLLKIESGLYLKNNHISQNLSEEFHGSEAKKAEFIELVEALAATNSDKVLRFQKIALDPRDEKIFKAMLWNLESFLKDAHQKAKSQIPVKNRKVIFWGMGDVQKLIGEIIKVN